MAQTLRLFTQITPVLLQLALLARAADVAAQPATERAQPAAQPAAEATPAAPTAQAPSAAPVEAQPTPVPNEPATAAAPAPAASDSARAPGAPVGPCPCAPATANASSNSSDGIQLASSNATPSLDTVRSAPKRPIREENPWALSGVFGWNSLVGFGPVASHHFTPHFTLDAGAGLSLEGAKFGAQGRFNFLKSDLTPFVGLGAMHALGVDRMTMREVRENDDDDGFETGDFIADVRIKPSTYAQLVTGLDWIDRNNNINLTGTIGYAQLLQKDNVEVLSGSLEPEDRDQADLTFGSGLVVSLGMGYSF